MRIALVAPFAMYPKGTTRWRVLPLARALAARGHAVRVVVPPYDWPVHGGLIWHDDGVQMVNVPVPVEPSLIGHCLLAGRLVQVVLAWRPAVVHSFKPKGYSGLAAAALLLARRVPVVVDADDYEAGWNEALPYPLHWRVLFRWQEHSLLRRADAVTAASRWLEAYAASLGQPRRFYLPNGVEGSCSQDATRQQTTILTSDTQPGRRVLLYTRFIEHSAQDVWQVWRQVLRAEPSARLLIAGRGRAGEEHLVAQMAAEAGAARSVQVLGWLPSCARPGLFEAVDAAMLPVQDTSLNRAKSPMRLLDLLAAGVPVATQQVGEYGALVVDGVSGLLAPPGDSAALARQVIALLRQPELGQRLSAAACAEMRARFAWSELAEIALRAYQAADCRSPCAAV